MGIAVSFLSGQLIESSFRLCLSKNGFILPSLLKGIFPTYGILRCNSFSYVHTHTHTQNSERARKIPQAGRTRLLPVSPSETSLDAAVEDLAEVIEILD